MKMKNPVSGLMVEAIPCGHCGGPFPPVYVILGWTNAFCADCQHSHYCLKPREECPSCIEDAEEAAEQRQHGGTLTCILCRSEFTDPAVFEEHEAEHAACGGRHVR